jgi:hypothetical protein
MSSRLKFWIVLGALNGAIWLFFVRERPEARARSSNGQLSAQNTVTQAAPRPVPSIVVRTNAFQWGQLESEDYRSYIDRLRTIGCPEETIRDIVIADLEKLMAPEMQEVEGRREAPKYWEPKAVTRTLDSLAKIGKKQDIDFRKREIVSELLGIDLAAERARTKGEGDFYEERLGFLESEKQMRVRIALEKANRAETFLREKSWLENDELTAEERQELRDIQKAKEQEVAQVLSPEELDRYHLWFSSSAYRVRDLFLALEPNEQDFLEIYRIQREFDSQWEGVEQSTLSATEKNDYQQAQKKYDDQLREYLGADRYEKLLQTREPDFRQLQETIAQFGLKPDTTAEIYSYKKALLEERARVAENRALSPEQREEIGKALGDETERAMVELMGPKPYRYYLRSGAGKWIVQ